MATRDFDLYVNPELPSKMKARLGELFNQIPKQQGSRTDLQPLPAVMKKSTDEPLVELEDAPTPVKPKPKLEVAAATAKE